ncbi:transport and Golgi organization protein 6 homolog [Mytilus trossulus]|uniref:transport and Golgi organization protein 6 homolog n=1 Tax=Mytilus trossulus TaxID=6551 RepID=UPI0030058996
MDNPLSDPGLVLEALKHLTTPASQTHNTDNDTSNLNTFDLLLNSCIDKFFHETQKDKFQELYAYFKNMGHTETVKTGFELRWTFTCLCLKVLEILCSSIERAMIIFQKEQEAKLSSQGSELKPSQAPPLSPDTLSVAQQKTVLTTIQFIIVLGISPYLQEGVGLQATQRSGFWEVIDLQTKDKSINSIEKDLRMIQCLQVLLKCCKVESLGTLILSRHLGDILAALLQLVNGQKIMQNQVKPSQETDCAREPKLSHDLNTEKNTSKIQSEKWTPATIVDMALSGQIGQGTSKLQDKQICTDKISDSGKNKVQENKRSVVSKEDVNFCEESLNNLLEKISQPLLVRELMVLQGGPGKQPVQKGDGVNRQVKPILIKAPVWLRKICGQLLTGILMKPQGVHHVLHGMLGNAVADVSGNLIADWRRFDAVAKVIASCPKMCTSAEEYFKLVSPQILSLLHQPNKQIAKHFLRVACSTIVNMATSSPDLTEKYIIKPLLKPLLLCTQDNDYVISDTQQIIVDEKSLSLCVEDIHKVFVACTEPNSTLCIYLIPVLQPLFHLYCFSQKGISHLKSAIHEILTTSLKQYSKTKSLQYLQCLLLDTPSTQDMMYLHPNLMFAPANGGGIVIVTRKKDEQDKSQIWSDGVLELLKDLQTCGLPGDFFLYMMKELSSIIKDEITEPSVQLPHGRNVLDNDLCSKKIHILNLLASLCESIGPSCLTNTQQTLDFVEVTLERAVHVLQACDDETTTVFENETLTMAMGLITSVLSGGLKCTEEDREHMQKLLPLLQILVDSHPDLEVQEMASDIRVAIATHGVVWSDRLSKSSQKKKEKSEESPKLDGKVKSKGKPLIEVLDSEDHGSSKQFLKHSEDKETHYSSFKEALKELCDPLIPIRGHGLISLCKLVENKDNETKEKQEVVLKIFEENLSHPDSYLYLSSARGLSLLADKFPDLVIPKLTSEFADFDKNGRSVELRMKIGECIVQTTRRLGSMAPKYRDILLPSILSGARDKDPLVRASSLSNLGEICKVVRFSLGNVIREIFECCQSLLKTDDSPEVRKAAAMLTTMLLQGLGKDMLQVLESVLRDLYHLLKLTLKTEKEEKVKDHILLSLNELDDIMKDYLFPKQTLQKKITVLGQT